MAAPSTARSFGIRLIDEFSTLIQPAVDGVAGSPSIVDYRRTDGVSPGAGQALRLIGCETLDGGMVWLRHVVEDAPASTSTTRHLLGVTAPR